MAVNGQLQRVHNLYGKQPRLKLRPKLPTKAASQKIRASELRAQVLEKLYLRTESTIILFIQSMESAELGRRATPPMLRAIYNAQGAYSREGTIDTFSISRMPSCKEVGQAWELTRQAKEAYMQGSKPGCLRIISQAEGHVLFGLTLQAQINLLVMLHEMVKSQDYSGFFELRELLRQESSSKKVKFSPLSEELNVYRALSLEGTLRAVEELQSLQKNAHQ